MRDLRIELTELLLKIQDETEYGVFFYFHGHVKRIFNISLSRSKDDFTNKVYETEGLKVEELPRVYEELLSFLPKENRPDGNQDDSNQNDDQIIYQSSLTQNSKNEEDA